MMTVVLSEADMARADRLAFMRNAGKVDGGINHRSSKSGDLDIHKIGLRGEVAASKLFGFPIDESIALGGDDGAPDIYIGEYRAEIKSCKYSPPIIKLDTLMEFKSDLMVVCYCPPIGSRFESRIEVWGCVSRVRFLRMYGQHDFGYGERVVLAPDKLAPIAALSQYFSERYKVKA